MLVHRSKEKKVVWELDSIIMQTISHHLQLFCAPTWPSYHVIENHLLAILTTITFSTNYFASFLQFST